MSDYEGKLILDESVLIDQEDWGKLMRVLHRHVDTLNSIPSEVLQTAMHHGYTNASSIIREGIQRYPRPVARKEQGHE
jgi:asparagine synthetase A